MQQGSLPGGPDQWTTHFNPNVGQQVAHNLTTGDELVWDPTKEEWNPAPEIPEIVVSATREPSAAQYAADQQQLANQSNELAGEVFGSLGPWALAKGIYNSALGVVSNAAYLDLRLFGASTQTADRWASYINRAQVSPGALEEAMGQSASPYLQAGYKALTGLVGSDYADDLSHLASLGLNGLGVLPAVEPMSTVGSSLRESIGQLGDIFPSGSAGSVGTGGAPLRAQLGTLDLSLVPESSGAPIVGPSAPLEADATSVFHATPTVGAVTNILEKGINPAFFSPNTRFGPAFYVAEQPETSLAEVPNSTMGIRFAVNSDALNVLDLTDQEVAAEWGYQGGPITPATQSIGSEAAAAGYNAIRYSSEAALGGTNLAILGDFDTILRPVMVSPTVP